LDRLHRSNEGLHLHDERLWHTGAAQEDFGDLTLGFVDRLDADDGRAMVAYAFKSQDVTQINVQKECKFYHCSGEVRPAEVCPSEVRLD
jgi:hypothetical protein